jgi:SPP1 family predicted phage head-tail adaptor
MRAGKLHERITIQEATEAADGSGQLARTWATHKSNVPAEHVDGNGGEVYRGRQVSAQSAHLFRIRTISTVTVEMRVLWNSLYYGIENIKEPFSGEMWLECRTAD